MALGTNFEGELSQSTLDLYELEVAYSQDPEPEN